ncbi:MAG: endonuclease MutS2 [Spirochaetes bacterium]|nr:endonuclease MutS2 [Spirochaetota bacterium]
MEISEKAKRALEWYEIIDFLEGQCKTPLGKIFAKNIQPLSYDRSRQRMEEISQLKAIRIIEHESLDFDGIFDVRALMDFVSKGGVLSIEELVAIRNFLLGQERISRFLRNHRKKYPRIGQWVERIVPLPEIVDLLKTSLTEWNSLNRKKYPVIEKIEREIVQLRSEIERRLFEIMREHSAKNILQGNSFTTRSGRYVLPLKSGCAGKVKGTVMDISSSAATVYVEPEAISELNNRIIEKEHELKSEITKILQKLSADVAKYAREIASNGEVIGELDFLNSASILSERLRANAPDLVQETGIDLIDVRHPLLALMNYETTVPNSVKLFGERRCLIISGTNAGGKTVFLKAVGLSALMAVHGLHISASADSRISMFKKVFVDIGDEQNLVHSLSTFSAQLVAIAEMIEHADSQSLILIDEIVVGTDPRQGAALARAILEHLAATGAYIVVTTHYSELKRFAAMDERFLNASVSFDAETLAPTYRLTMGIPGASHAFEIAKKYGMPQKIIERAQSFLDENDLSTDALIDKIQKLEGELFAEKAAVALLKDELKKEKQELEDHKKKLAASQAKKEIEGGSEFLQEIRQIRARIREHEKSLNDADSKTISLLRAELDSEERKILEMMRSAEEIVHCENLLRVDENSVKEGMEVFILPLKKWATVNSIDGNKKEAQVTVGNSLKARYPFRDLFVKKTLHNFQKQHVPKGEQRVLDDDFIPVTIPTAYNTIDLRGKRVDEAITTMNAMLDAMVRNSIRSAIIIHGHGTGALKEAVRKELKYCPYAEAFRPGEMGEGGDGVTVVLLRS